MKVYCFKCSHLTDVSGKISFRAVCPQCGSDLHVCRTCRYYSPGKPNNCAVPETDPIQDREAANFCEEFSPLDSISPKGNYSAFERAKRLFGEEPPKKKNPLQDEEPL